MASFTKEVNPRLAKRPLKTNGRLANRELTSLAKAATEIQALNPLGINTAWVKFCAFRQTLLQADTLWN